MFEINRQKWIVSEEDILYELSLDVVMRMKRPISHSERNLPQDEHKRAVEGATTKLTFYEISDY